jgi:hypothetical protein
MVDITIFGLFFGLVLADIRAAVIIKKYSLVYPVAITVCFMTSAN